MKNFLKKIWSAEKHDNALYFGISDLGLRRENNEDAFAILPERDLYIVADGMGGHNAGEVAASQAILAIDEYFTHLIVGTMRSDEKTVREHMDRAFMLASKSIYEIAKKDPSMDGMGCAIMMAFVHKNKLHTCHVGDARCYICSSKGIEQIGNDHSQVWDLVRTGQLTPTEARTHRLKNYLTQAMGHRIAPAAEYHIRELQMQEKVVLCSDGLWDMLSDEEIHAIVTKHSSPRGACFELIEKANDAGGRDNITVVIFKHEKSE